MSDPHLDSAVLATLREVMEGDYPLLLDIFLADSEERLRLLQRACAAADSEALRQTAHSFKGSCGNLGAVRLARLCQGLEQQMLGQGANVAAWIERIEEELATVRRLCEAERQRYRAED